MSSKVIDFSWYLNLSLCFWEKAGLACSLHLQQPPTSPLLFLVRPHLQTCESFLGADWLVPLSLACSLPGLCGKLVIVGEK